MSLDVKHVAICDESARAKCCVQCTVEPYSNQTAEFAELIPAPMIFPFGSLQWLMHNRLGCMA